MFSVNQNSRFSVGPNPIQMSDDNYWIGVRDDTGGMWLHDPEMAHEDPTIVYAFDVTHFRMREYPKKLVAEILTPLNDTRRDQAIAKYQQWKASHGKTFLEDERVRVQKRIEDERVRVQKHKDEAIARHRAYLQEHGKVYEGVSERSSKQHRVTHCYSCREPLDSSLHVECNSCGWLICYCGACGCGYEKWL